MLHFDPKPPEEALAWWQNKVPVSKDEFENMTAEARARAFTVSGLHKLDQVSLVHKAIGDAMAAGRPMEEFKREMGKKLDGKLSSYRLETVYRTNVQSAYHAGRYSQMMQVSENMPWWRYVSVDDSRTRPSHKALHGLVRRYDDPFWDAFYPPNGFRCRCTVQALSDRQMERKGYEAGEGTPGMMVWIDPQTGAETPVVPRPDLGFHGNVGKQHWLETLLPLVSAKLAALPAAIGASFTSKGQVESFAFWHNNPKGDFPVAVLADAHAAKIGAKTKVVHISPETARKQADRHPELSATEYLRVQDTISHGEAIQDGLKTLVFILDAADGYVSVVKATQTGKALYLTSFRRLSADEAKRDKEILRLRKKGE